VRSFRIAGSFISTIIRACGVSVFLVIDAFLSATALRAGSFRTDYTLHSRGLVMK
jgi:hypothetical protein